MSDRYNINICVSDIGALIGEFGARSATAAFNRVFHRFVTTGIMRAKPWEDFLPRDAKAQLVTDVRRCKTVEQLDAVKRRANAAIVAGNRVRPDSVDVRDIDSARAVADDLLARKIDTSPSFRAAATQLSNYRRLCRQLVDGAERAAARFDAIAQKINNCNHFVNKRFGVAQEKFLIGAFNAKFGGVWRITRSPFAKRRRETQEPIVSSDYFDCNLTGVIDGMIDDRIVEIKTRVTDFGKPIPAYELAQVHAYMHMWGAATCYLVEFCPRDDQDLGASINKHIVHFDHDFWQSVKERLLAIFHFADTLFAQKDTRENYNEDPELQVAEIGARVCHRT